MKSSLTRSFNSLSANLATFTLAQKVIAGVGIVALLMGGVMLFRWVAQPQYSPLFTNLAPADASAVVDQLETDGTPYELGNDGTTILVPREEVYGTRIALSGEGLPASSGDGGYSLLDEQDLSTSQFQEQTDFKRAMEGELSNTIMAMDGISGAVVHLALPEKEVFSDEQAPPTASVLLKTRAGTTMGPEQVQSIVHLVASSIDGMEPEKVTVADSSGTLLSSDDSNGGAFASSREQYTQDVQNQYKQQVQSMLDRVLGAGNSTVEVKANIDFDKATTESRTYRQPNGGGLALSSTRNTERYAGSVPGGGATGVVGPDGQMDPATGTGSDPSSYEQTSETSDNALNTTVEQREKAPGSLQSLNIATVIDRTAAANNDPQEIERMIASALGIDAQRGDTNRVSVLPFDRSAEEAAAAELEAQADVTAEAERMGMFRNVGIAAAAVLALLLAWLHSRRRAKQRREATNYVIEHLRSEPVQQAPEQLESPASALLSLERAQDQGTREELIALVESQPEDVANLLRGWLVER
jgi:flagellar M-ring protein FliF